MKNTLEQDFQLLLLEDYGVLEDADDIYRKIEALFFYHRDPVRRRKFDPVSAYRFVCSVVRRTFPHLADVVLPEKDDFPWEEEAPTLGMRLSKYEQAIADLLDDVLLSLDTDEIKKCQYRPDPNLQALMSFA